MSLNANDPTRWTRLPQLTISSLDSATEHWLAAELRSDHAGETGAVAIYNGILRATHDPELISFALDHRETEDRHLASIEDLVSVSDRSRLLFAWRIAGFATGFIPALLGRKAVYALSLIHI